MSNLDFLSYDSNIPMAMWFNENLEPNAVKLYAFVRGLSNKYGYCFATNAYLAELMKATPRSVQGWLSMLKKENYIEIETSKKGIHWERNIYISDKFKKSLRREAQFTPPRTTVHPPMKHISPIIKEYPNGDIEKGSPPTPSGEDVFLFGKFVKLTRDDLTKLCNKFGRENVLDMIDQINDHISSTGRKPYNDYAATLRNWFRRRKSQPKDSHSIPKEKAPGEIEGENRQWKSEQEKIFFSYAKEGKLHFGNNYIEFPNQVKIYVNMTNFIDLCKEEMRKMGIMV